MHSTAAASRPLIVLRGDRSLDYGPGDGGDGRAGPGGLYLDLAGHRRFSFTAITGTTMGDIAFRKRRKIGLAAALLAAAWACWWSAGDAGRAH